MAVARSFSDGIAMRYVLPVLRVTLFIHTVEPMDGRAPHCVVCSRAGPMGEGAIAGHGPLRTTGSLARRAGLLGLMAGGVLALWWLK